ncbi:CD276 antigen-like isoform X5 [Gambusia affinis]|uniref:CD276 antigen-like isoform X5 n=1 Tax=Gambusia affinis TaxID=33528 RepID=UPI001CDD4995|nr:CD276 antigen-like isoform X5 [Gambusia affinis]
MFCCLSSSSSLRMKMISSILLLLILSSCLCATFVVNVKQSSYQAEENHSITLEWTFTNRPDSSLSSMFILCEFLAPPRGLVLYQVHKGVEIPESQDEQFSGRVQSDKDVLREGRIRLHVSRLRTEDSGLYLCDVKTEDGFNSGRCRLNVTEVKDVGQNLIHAKVGDDVILPCHLEPPFDVNRLTIEWRFKGQIILVYHSGAEDDKTSDPKYQDRIFMFHDEFKNGNISLKLIKVTKEDEGIYTCFVPNLQSKVRKVNVTLKLEPHPRVIVVGGVVVHVVLVGSLIIIIFIFIFIIYYGVRRRRDEQIFHARAATLDTNKGEMMEGWKQNNSRIGEETVTKEMKIKKDILQEQQNQSV